MFGNARRRDWFEQLFDFRESQDYGDTKSKFEVEGASKILSFRPCFVALTRSLMTRFNRRAAQIAREQSKL
jgi:hypothetical protein